MAYFFFKEWILKEAIVNVLYRSYQTRFWNVGLEADWSLDPTFKMLECFLQGVHQWQYMYLHSYGWCGNIRWEGYESQEQISRKISWNIKLMWITTSSNDSRLTKGIHYIQLIKQVMKSQKMLMQSVHRHQICMMSCLIKFYYGDRQFPLSVQRHQSGRQMVCSLKQVFHVCWKIHY